MPKAPAIPDLLGSALALLLAPGAAAAVGTAFFITLADLGGPGGPAVRAGLIYGLMALVCVNLIQSLPFSSKGRWRAHFAWVPVRADGPWRSDSRRWIWLRLYQRRVSAAPDGRRYCEYRWSAADAD